ncbi:DHA2 family efflux MFS transporter permease subunit [Solirhodobacter olei]|uniref:DHA2 family efflux MFS transporter permease subunit n=1 Tax=Solirhodobacter olei TaxID=2493082 RepID=UPI000FDC83E4|nr:DHA2 family efflux MFS transporter permease subunit [Solirhodobacter olei]
MAEEARLPRSAAGAAGPWVMTWAISLATFMEVLDVSIANVALNNIAGSLAVSYSQGTWMITTYLVANAVVIPITGFLSRVLGRKRYFQISITLFTLSSVACAFAPTLGFLLFARTLQGVGGGGLAPVEQSMLADSFEPHRRGIAFAAFGMVIVVGPIFGPTLGGWITDAISWHWIFLINLPVGILALVLSGAFVVEAPVLQEETRRTREGGIRIDWVGFLFMAVGVGCLLIMLDRGQQDAWFSSDFIRILAVLTLLGLGGMTVWELNHDDPIVPLQLLGVHNFRICSILIALVGLLVFGTIQLVPELLQRVYGYTAYEAGLALTIGGIFTIVVMPLSGILSDRLDLRLLLVPGFLVQAVSFHYLSQFSLASTFWNAVTARFYISIGLPFLFIPISTAAYLELPPGGADKASALLNFFRNLGGAFGISLCQTLLAQREQFHQVRLTEGLNMLNPTFSTAVRQLGSTLGSQQAAIGKIYGMTRLQASVMSYDDVFHVLTIAVLFVVPLVLMLRVGSRKARAAASQPAH